MKNIAAISLSILMLLSPVFLIAQAQQSAAESTGEQETSEQEVSEEEAKYWDWANGIWDSLDRQTGVIEIKEANATLKVPDNFYYLNTADAEKVLSEVWGNPPGELTLGMLFPNEFTPFDGEAWAVTIEYEEDGYVSDADAKDLDYTDILKQLQKDTRDASDYRVEEGYETIELVGWAADPYYDSATNKLYWAKELNFGEQDVNTLNYNIRVLGRKGVLVLNFIASIDQKTLIEENLPAVLEIAVFDSGSSYGDFNPDTDKLAAYGIGALVAGKLAAKTGLIAAALIFLKKFGVFLVLGVAALLKKVFSKDKA